MEQDSTGLKAGLWLLAAAVLWGLGHAPQRAQASAYTLVEEGSTYSSAAEAGYDPFLTAHPFSDQTAGAYMQTFTVGASGLLSTLNVDFAHQNPTDEDYSGYVTVNVFNLGPDGYSGQSLTPDSTEVLWAWELYGGYWIPFRLDRPVPGLSRDATLVTTIQYDGSGPGGKPVAPGDVIAVIAEGFIEEGVPETVRLGLPYGVGDEYNPAPYPGGQAYLITSDGTVESDGNKDYRLSWKIYRPVPEPGAVGILAIVALLFALRGAAERRGPQA